ncbi:hypothetical protein [Arcobacter sp.]|uniref:hypothetical protein n=1 Tax=unclassified Arcobacter TaxID=2593671 RepID=UPI003B003D53|eukprot:TRINITY_DN7406_c0_g1_i1.p1 TRINITY_DN7406_c0_g1~~TRINITY_DN7406_c0_g1_i1.p1  ORF type:complete len:425 (-),score=-9.84 TRINITY_DN7406_c0_g1_i1:1118-2392(-)
MAENKEKTEAELLEETMQNLGLEEVLDEKKSEDLLVERSNSSLSDEEIESLIKDDDPSEEVIEEIKSNNNETKSNNSNEDEISPVDDINLNNTSIDNDEGIGLNEEIPIQKKQNKFVKILTIVISILLSLVSIGAVLYLIGVFDPKPVVKQPKAQEVKVQKEEYQFTPNDIDANRLNKKLNLLTKYEIVENSTTEEQKAQEKENLYLEAKKQLEMERLAKIEKIKEAERKRMEEVLPAIKKENIDENIDKQIDNVITTKDDTKEGENVPTDSSDKVDENTNQETEQPTLTTDTPNEETKVTTNAQVESNKAEETTPSIEDTTKENEVVKVEPEIVKEKVNQFVKVIKIQTKSKDIYKSFLDKVYSVNDSITLCRDYQNNVEIFVGPFENDIEREKVAKEYLLKYNINVEIYDYTTEEYDKRCNY